MQDGMRQVTGCFAGAKVDASFALTLLKCQKHLRAVAQYREGLALIVHHGGTVHELRSAKHVLVCSTSSKSLLHRQLCDRIEVMSGRPQIYGTQWRVNRATGESVPFPMRGVAE